MTNTKQYQRLNTVWGTGGREFKSRRSDQTISTACEPFRPRDVPHSVPHPVGRFIHGMFRPGRAGIADALTLAALVATLLAGAATVLVVALSKPAAGRPHPFDLWTPARSAHASLACVPLSLRTMLARVEARFGPTVVISTYRPGAVVRGTQTRSYHADCRAIDFRPPPGTYRAVVAWLNAHHDGGVLTYTSGHIHIDNGARVRGR